MPDRKHEWSVRLPVFAPAVLVSGQAVVSGAETGPDRRRSCGAAPVAVAHHAPLRPPPVLANTPVRSGATPAVGGETPAMSVTRLGFHRGVGSTGARWDTDGRGAARSGPGPTGGAVPLLGLAWSSIPLLVFCCGSCHFSFAVQHENAASAVRVPGSRPAAGWRAPGGPGSRRWSQTIGRREAWTTGRARLRWSEPMEKRAPG